MESVALPASLKSPAWKATFCRCRKSLNSCAPAPAKTELSLAISKRLVCARASLAIWCPKASRFRATISIRAKLYSRDVVRTRSHLSGLRLRGGLGRAVHRRLLSVVLFRCVLPLQHQPSLAADEGPPRSRRAPVRPPSRARSDGPRRLPLA